MAEIADWSPVDESNNSAPPVGAPEMMATSSVNNVMRAMMGSIRRWYDTVISTYLPLSGGVITGDTTFNGPNGININGMQLNNGGLNSLEVSHPTYGGIGATGPNAHLGFGDRDMASAAWLWYANAGMAHLLRSDGSDLIKVSWAGQVWVTGNFNASGNVAVGNGLTVDSNITAAGSVTAAFVDSNGGINADGNITAGGSVTAAFLDSNGGLDADGDASIGGNLAVSGQSTLSHVHIAGQISAIGGDSNFNIHKSGAAYIINFEPNTYLIFNATTNQFSIVIDGVVKASW